MTMPHPGLDAAQFFDRFATQFDTLYDGQRGPLMRWLDRRFRSDMFVRFALTFEAFGDLAGRSVLDIGCGSGPYVIEALRRGAAEVTALDPADGMLALVKSKLDRLPSPAPCTLVRGLFPGPALEPHDFVIVMGVMDYVADAQGFLDALRPLVRRKAALSFPSRHWFRTPLRVARYRLRRCPLYFYDERRIGELARRAGFTTIEIKKIPGAGLDYHACMSH
jgi:2-polyprenyl-3-methyl-5-hydroxy-6-metoxy-1,4-benzoquinol methylase